MASVAEATPTRVHRDVIDALAATVYPPAYAPYPDWVRNPRTEAEFIASLVIHFRDSVLPEKFRYGPPFAPRCDADGYVTGVPLRVKGQQ